MQAGKLLLVLVGLFLSYGPLVKGQALADRGEVVSFSIPKTIYFGGERIWIASSVREGGLPAESKIVYAELLDRNNQSVAITKMPLDAGAGFNFLQLPTDLPSDHYLLRVFTRISPYQSLETGIVQRFVTVFNRQLPPTVVPVRENVKAPPLETSSRILLSDTTAAPGSVLKFTLPSGVEVQEISIAAVNPFLAIQDTLSSSLVYESLESRTLVPELFGHIIEAQIEGTVDTTQLYYISVHGEKSALFTDRPNPDGTLFFDAGGMKNWNYLVAQADGNQSLLDFNVVQPAPRTKFKPGFDFPELLITPADEVYLTSLLRSGQIEGYFSQEFDASLFPVVTGFVADREYMLDDYTRFETVETVIKEYVPEVSVRTVKRRKELRALNEIKSGPFDSNPLMLVDAMPVFDSDILASFNPKGFEKLEVLARTFFLNEQSFQGVVSFSSYQNDFGGFPIPSNGIYLDYKGIQPRITSSTTLFDSPEDKNGIMDWRTVLFWSEVTPVANASTELSVKLPVNPGRFEIKVKGKNKLGQPEIISSQFTIGER